MTARSWQTREPQRLVPPAAVVLSLLAVLFAMAALVQIHSICMERAAGDPAAVEQCRNQR